MRDITTTAFLFEGVVADQVVINGMTGGFMGLVVGVTVN
jgi:hypothetical protein